jgi:hypothetical protein
MHSVVRNIIMLSGYFDTDTKARKVFNILRNGGESRH